MLGCANRRGGIKQHRHQELHLYAVLPLFTLRTRREPSKNKQKFIYFTANKTRPSTERSCSPEPELAQQNQFLHQAKQSSSTRHNKPTIIRVLCGGD